MDDKNEIKQQYYYNEETDTETNNITSDNGKKYHDMLEENQVRVAEQELTDLKHDVENKEQLVKHTITILRLLYGLAVILTIPIVCYVMHKGALSSWPLLTFSLLLLSIPIILHSSVLNKLFKTDTQHYISTEHPLLNAITRLVDAIATRLDKTNQ